MAELTESDLQHLRACFALARSARERGDTPFGARLVGRDGAVLLEATNTTVSARDVTAHAETSLVRAASSRYPPAELVHMTLYSSAEPCAMCAGAIAWSGIGRVVYALSAERVRELDGPVFSAPTASGRMVMETATGAPRVLGPALEEEAASVFQAAYNQGS
jgi:tRNA(adenine34) deaminase